MSTKKEITVLDMITYASESGIDLKLECIAGQQGVNKKISRTLNRPGLALNGEFLGFEAHRVQIFGRGEVEYLYSLEKRGKLVDILNSFFAYEIPCCVVSHANMNKPPQIFIDYCEKQKCPLLYSNQSSADLTTSLFQTINELFAPEEVIHGVFLEVHDLGVLIKGSSGIGKSEIALELIEKNKYRLIADDVVLMKRVDQHTVIGTSSGLKQYRHNLEIRGLGLVNVAQIYGIGVTLNSRKLDMVVELQEWVENEDEGERLDVEQSTNILGVDFPYVCLHVKAGRNVSLLIETAAIKHRLTSMGYHGKENIYLW